VRVDVVLVPQRADIRQVRPALDQTLMVCKCYGQESQPTGILCTPAFDARGAHGRRLLFTSPISL
jgi:hypothetical protein